MPLVGRHEELAEIQRLVATTRSGMSGAARIPWRTRSRQDRPTSCCGRRRTRPSASAPRRGRGRARVRVRRTAAIRLPAPAPCDELPAPQRNAIEVAFGLSLGAPADLYLVGLATLNLLAHVADGQPTLVTIDDAQWLDRESLVVLGFAARRLDAESMVMLFAARHGTDLSPLDGLGTFEVTDLEPDDALELLRHVVGTGIDPASLTACCRSPAATRLPCRISAPRLSAAQLDASERLPEPLTVGQPARAPLRRRRRPAPRRHPHLARARRRRVDRRHRHGDDRGDTDGPPAGDAAAPAERAGIVSVRNGVEFRHPLIRSAIYSSAATRRPPSCSPRTRPVDPEGPRS